MTHPIGTAVVLGGSLSGLVSAAVLARHARRVVIVERDPLGTGATRKGVPQGRHNHNLAPPGLAELERLYPGMRSELSARGATIADVGSEGRWSFRGTRFARAEVGHDGLFSSRALLEDVVYRRTASLPNVELRDRTDMLGLEREGGRVTGVKLVGRDDERGSEVLGADLVVDAMGRGSRVPAWFEAFGHERPRVESLEVRVAYTTRVFRRPPGTRDKYFFVTGAPPSVPRGGVAFAVDGDRWMVLLFGYGGPKAPADLVGFVEYARSLASPDIAELVSGLEPLDDGCVFSFPRATRLRYDEIRRPLERLLVLGDALQSTNPSYGLGMTSLLLQARALDGALARGLRGIERRFFTGAIRASAPIWDMTTANDSAYDSVPAPDRTPAFLARYFDAFCAVASTDPVAARAMLRVGMFVAPRISVLAPWLVLRVLWKRWTDARARAEPKLLSA
jgi:2-polyprenyl-6-methoxyphenol hydroxylase-like FAD-dependent oxidoreductase